MFRLTQSARAAVVIAALLLGVAAYRLLHHDLHQTVLRSLPAVAIGWTAIAAGLIAAARRPHNRMGLLMIAYGFAVLVRTWQYSPDELVFTVGLLLGQLNLALFAHVTLAFPSGALTDRVERAFVGAAYVVALAFPFATLLVVEEGAALTYAPLAPGSPIAIAPDAELARDIEQAFVLVGYGLMAAIFVGLVVRKLLRPSPAARRIRAPLLLAALLAASRALVECVASLGGTLPAGLVDNEYWWQVVGQIALPLMLLHRLLSSRLASANVANLLRDLDRATPAELSGAFGRALGDPSFEVLFWLPDQGAYADAAGVVKPLPDEQSGRAVTLVDHDDAQIAALIHDPILLDDPELIESAAAAARYGLENAQLQAEVKAQLERVRESRARLVTAGDEQRRRIERDIHDGAQQRLVALAIELRSTRRRQAGVLDPELEAVLDNAVGELQLAVTELRELARGVHPAILTEDGLGAALETLAARSPVPVEILAVPRQRLSPEIEVAAYYVACEALANTAKHADASSVTIRAEVVRDVLTLEVTDDGRGGADAGAGSGLRGLADRVEAHGGSLRITDAAGHAGTRVRAELPCAS